MADSEKVLHPAVVDLPELSIAEQAAQLVQVDAKSRQEIILAAKNGLALARSLSSETLLYTIKEIGPNDAVGLLAIAAPEQVRDMLDLDCWRSDRLDSDRLIKWLMLLDEGGSSKLAEWFLHADIEILVMLIKRYFEVVRKADIEEDTDFDQSKYFTFDDQYLLRFLGEPEPILHLLLERVRTLDYRVYLYALENSLFEFESGLEEDAFRWRTARLEDRGYPTYEEAQTLFRFIPPESIRIEQYQRVADPMHLAAGDDDITPPDHALALMAEPTSFFSQILASLPRKTREHISQELAYLTNIIVTAEARDTGEVGEIRRCVAMAHDYVNIGLAFIAKDDADAAQDVLQTTQIRPFFQTGWALIQRLQQQAHDLAAQLDAGGLFAWESYLDTPFREMCAGVQAKAPLFFVGLEMPGEIQSRRFSQLSEVRRVESLLAQIPTWFHVLQRLAIMPEEKAPEGVTLSVLWNTAFARWVLEGQVTIHPLNRTELQTLHDQLSHAALEERWNTFESDVAVQCDVTPEERIALGTLATHARDKIEEVLVIDTQTADLRFVEGLLVAG